MIKDILSPSVDYRYKTGDKYTGPVLFGVKIFEDAGANIMMSAGSGTPYSRQSNITQEACLMELMIVLLLWVVLMDLDYHGSSD